MYSKELEELIEMVLEDGVITDKERKVLYTRAKAEGVDTDELDIVLEGRLAKMRKAQGAAAPTPPVAPAPSQKDATRHGELTKCPVCGAVVDGGIPVCPECNYAFRGLEANSSVAKLTDILNAISKKFEGLNLKHQEKSSGNVFASIFDDTQAENLKQCISTTNNAIINFAVPTTKEDLMEFILFLEPKTRGGLTAPHFHNKGAYRAKFDECCTKAMVFFPNDPVVQNVLIEVGKLKSPDNQEKKGFFKKMFGK